MVCNGKYKANVMKFHLIVSYTGEPMIVDGPHAGVHHDALLWAKFLLPFMSEGVYVFGDKGYQGCEQVKTPHKRPRGMELDPLDQDYNDVLGYLFRLVN
jgi:hypothetical protein